MTGQRSLLGILFTIQLIQLSDRSEDTTYVDVAALSTFQCLLDMIDSPHFVMHAQLLACSSDSWAVSLCKRQRFWISEVYSVSVGTDMGYSPPKMGHARKGSLSTLAALSRQTWPNPQALKPDVFSVLQLSTM